MFGSRALIISFSFLIISSAAMFFMLPTKAAFATSMNTTFSGVQNGALQPTTTLAAEQADTISKVPTRTLMYQGSNTPIFAHLLPWFGSSWHISVGYDSRDPATAQRQVNDMQSRGINGAIVDWYGPAGVFEDTATSVFVNEANKHPGFKVIIMEDWGAYATCAKQAGCNYQQQIVTDLNYAMSKYGSTGAYYKVNGRPVVVTFGDFRYPVDWTAVQKGVSGNPIILLYYKNAFTTPSSGGAYSWIEFGSSSKDMGLSWLDDYYAYSKNFPGMLTFGSAYPGFNETLSAFSPPTGKRIMDNQCGATWLATFSELPKYFSPSNQLGGLQIATWNDYEEGTTIERGVDNCVTLTASISGNTLSWNIGGGNEHAIDHYAVFASTDGQNLAALADVPAGVHTIDLGQSSLAVGKYIVYVKAVGKPSILNKMSGAVSYNVAAPVQQAAQTQQQPPQQQPTSAPTQQQSAQLQQAAPATTSNASAAEQADTISKIPVQSMMYAGSTVPIFAHLMEWFGSSWHISVGYDSRDPATAQRQVNDMQSRGINGAIVDWYGPDSYENQGTAVFAAEAQKHAGFKFAIMEDAGAYRTCAQTAGCNYQQKLVNDLNYIVSNYASSPAYYKVNGRPVVLFMGDSQFAINWTAVQAGVAGNPVFVFNDKSGFTHQASGGAFSWITATSDAQNTGLSFLADFYSYAANFPLMLVMGSVYPGLNDALSPSSTGQIVNGQCGMTWVSGFGKMQNYYSASNQLGALQIVSWNNYEEGTAIEKGIDNCMSLTAGVTANTIGWSIGGADEQTVDHYTVFSTDGQNLTELANVTAGVHLLDLSQFNMSGSYTLYVKAVGKPSILNHVSNAVSYTASAACNGISGTVVTASGSVCSKCTLTVNVGGAAKTVTTLSDGSFAICA